MKQIFNKYSLYIIIALLIGIVVLIYLYFKKECVCITSTAIPINEMENIEITEEYYVDIKGEVLNPGVYKVDSNSRIIDIISIAGGFTNNADISLLNLSKKIIDEMNITIYSKEDVRKSKENLAEEPTVIEIIKEIEKECVCPTINDACINNLDKNNQTNEDVTDEVNLLININTDSIEKLITIPKIGESKAKNIVEYRKVNKFNTIEDIKNVSGIGDALFDSIKEYITV